MIVVLGLAASLGVGLPLSVGLTGGSRGLPRLGLGAELVWQSVNDTVLAGMVRMSGSSLGRYPGGTPSDYWDWKTGWASDLGSNAGPRPATPTTWAQYTQESATEFTVFDTNQLTRNLSYAIAGLHAHEAAGSKVRSPSQHRV